MSELPRLLPYPRLLPLAETPEIKGLLCYVIRHYGNSGLSVLISRVKRAGEIIASTKFGDWAGREHSCDGPLANLIAEFMARIWPKLISVMSLIKLGQAQFFFATQPAIQSLLTRPKTVTTADLVLTDVQLAADRLSGPGMVRDLFGRVLLVQDHLKVEVVDDRVLMAITSGTSGPLVLKPSKFRTVERPTTNLGLPQPLYVEIRP